MKKYIFVFCIIIFAIIGVNVCFNISIYKDGIGIQREQMSAQVEKTAFDIENEISSFRNSVNSILFSRIIDDLDLKSEDKTQEQLRMLEVLYNRFKDLITNISIYDLEGNILNLSWGRNNMLIIDPYTRQKNESLSGTEVFNISGEKCDYSIPVFKDNNLYANIIFNLNLNDYLKYKLNSLNDNNSWQWIIGPEGNIIYNSIDSTSDYSETGKIISDLSRDASDFIMHEANIGLKREKILSVYYPVNLFSERYALIRSTRRDISFRPMTAKTIASAIISLALLVLSIMYIFIRFRKLENTSENIKSEVSYYNLIFNTLPIGIMAVDEKRKVKLVNQAAKDILMIDRDEDIYGKSLEGRFMLSKDYYDNAISSAYDTEQYVVYRHQGDELSVYKKEVPFSINDEVLTLCAFIDISHIEKSRKYEAAANTAKSEFLANMSHEIRTPMNGIIGMTDALSKDDLSDSQQEKIKIIKKSADLLLSLIDDILDFSKIEAGKMLIEEIPFRLREEVRISLELFRPVIESKNLSLKLKINPNIPDNIISDPFRLRQILSNLISNSVKFTHEGEIEVGVELVEAYNQNLTLQFYVKDTGVGIPKSKIGSIFNAFTQAEESTSRKYGGSGLGTTISKQLVTLMNGEIWVESPCGTPIKPEYPGSKFCFTIEAYSNEKPVKDFSFENLLSSRDIKSLIVMQNHQSIQRLTKLLEHENISYHVFDYIDDNYDELNHLLNSPLKNTYHIVFIFNGQNFDGFKLANNLKKDGITDKYGFIMLSSAHKSLYYAESKKTGIDHYFPEPFDSPELISSIYDFFPNVLKPKKGPADLVRSDLSILIAEDNDINIKVAETILYRLGLKADFVSNGREAVDRIREKYYDIVFMDIVMPDFDGIQATVEIRASGYQMPIIAMTANASAKAKNRAIASGMNDYIVKPIRIEKIPYILSKWIA
jgi:signal transduction histidine kinase/CheY-like chemotaxis protein